MIYKYRYVFAFRGIFEVLRLRLAIHLIPRGCPTCMGEVDKLDYPRTFSSRTCSIPNYSVSPRTAESQGSHISALPYLGTPRFLRSLMTHESGIEDPLLLRLITRLDHSWTVSYGNFITRRNEVLMEFPLL